MIPFITTQTPRKGQATAYVCGDYICNLPMTEVDQMVSLLNAVR